MPAPVIRSTPKRAMSEPVKKLGTYIPSTCHWMTQLASPTEKPQSNMAIGVAVITRFIMPNDIIPHTTAAMNLGWAMIAESGRASWPAISTTCSFSRNRRVPMDATASIAVAT